MSTEIDNSPPSDVRPGYALVLNWGITKAGGVQGVVLNLARELLTHSKYRPVIVVASADPIEQPESFGGIEIVTLRLRPPLIQGVSLLRSTTYFLRSFPFDLVALGRFIRRYRIEVWNFHFPDLSALPVVLLRNPLPGKRILSLHGADVRSFPAPGAPLYSAWRLLLRKADAVIACSDALRREAEAFEPRAAMHTVYNGVDCSKFEGDRPSRPRTRLLSIAAFEYKKGLDILLRAFRVLSQTRPDVTLVMVGGEGPELPKLKQWIVDWGLERNVEVYVDIPHDAIAQFFRQTDVFVLPSRIEPFGLVLLEAGASGVPVVATRVGGIPELIDSESLGILVGPEEPDKLAEALKNILDDPGMADRLASNWQERVRSGWSWTNTLHGYLEILESL